MEVLLEQSQSGGVEGDFIELEDRYGHPKDGRMDGRFGAQQRQHTSETHDDGVDERRVGETLQCFDQNAQQLLDVAIRYHFADAAVDDQSSRLQCWIVAERKALGQSRPHLNIPSMVLVLVLV